MTTKKKGDTAVGVPRSKIIVKPTEQYVVHLYEATNSAGKQNAPKRVIRQVPLGNARVLAGRIPSIEVQQHGSSILTLIYEELPALQLKPLHPTHTHTPYVPLNASGSNTRTQDRSLSPETQ